MDYIPGLRTATSHGSQLAAIPQASSLRRILETNAIAMTVLGILQLVVGFLAVAFQAATIGIASKNEDNGTNEFVGCGIWCGIMFATSGCLGILAGRKNNKKLILSFLGFNIMITVMVWVLVGFAAVHLAMLEFCPPRSVPVSYSYQSYEYYYNESELASRVVTRTYSMYENKSDKSCLKTVTVRSWRTMNILLLVIAIFEFFVSITAAAFCCKQLPSCCGDILQAVILQPSIYVSTSSNLSMPSGQPIFEEQGFRMPGQLRSTPSTTSVENDRSNEVSLSRFRPSMVAEAEPPSYASVLSTSTGHYSAAATAELDHVCADTPVSTLV